MKKTENLKMKLVIKRKTWLRGATGGSGSSCLLDDKGRMCCLGFFGRARGLRPKEIRNVGTPSGVCEYDDKAVVKIFGPLVVLQEYKESEGYVEDSDLADHLMTANDDEDISDKSRETKIKKLFAKIGVKVTFVE